MAPPPVIVWEKVGRLLGARGGRESPTARAQLPEILEKLLDAARRVDAENWRLLPAAQSPAPRVVEYHSVGTNGSLPWPRHFDEGSLLTIDAMLSSTDDFDGGSFMTLEADGTLKPHPFERGDVQELFAAVMQPVHSA